MHQHGYLHHCPAHAEHVQERTQLQEMVRAQAQQLDVLRQEHGSTSKQHEAASVEVGRYKSELQAVQQQLASTQAVAEKRAQEVGGVGVAAGVRVGALPSTRERLEAAPSAAAAARQLVRMLGMCLSDTWLALTQSPPAACWRMQVLELNRMLQAWDEMRQAQDVQIAGLVARAAKAEALTCQQVAGVRSRRY